MGLLRACDGPCRTLDYQPAVEEDDGLVRWRVSMASADHFLVHAHPCGMSLSPSCAFPKEEWRFDKLSANEKGC